jgi:methyl-accepting chemotaxis protein
VLKAGVEVRVELSLIRLVAPVEVRVGNETYSVRYIVLGRLPVPEAASTGKAELVVRVNGTAGDQSFYNETVFEITVLNHWTVESTRLKAHLILSRTEALLLAAQALGIDVSREVEEFSMIRSSIEEADDMLFIREEVEEAVSVYEDSIRELERLASTIVTKLSGVAVALDELATRVSALEASVQVIDESLREAASKLEELSRDVSTSLETVREGLTSYGETLAELSRSVSDAIATLASQVNTLSEAVSKLSSDTNSALETLANSINELNAKVDAVASNQQVIASIVSATQNALLAVAVILLITSVISVIALKRLLKPSS